MESTEKLNGNISKLSDGLNLKYQFSLPQNRLESKFVPLD